MKKEIHQFHSIPIGFFIFGDEYKKKLGKAREGKIGKTLPLFFF